MFAGIVAVAVAVAVSSASAGTARTKLGLRPVVSGLNSPVYVASLPTQPSKLYVVEQVGDVKVIVNGKVRATPFLDIRNRVLAGGERGLFSIAFHPNYKMNHKCYVYYTDHDGNIRIDEYRGNGDVAFPTTRRQLLLVKHPKHANHNGGQLQFGPDGWLYAGTGDGGSGGDPNNHAQNLSSRLGKLLRINVNTRMPVVQIAGYGLRNPWRFSFDKPTGDLYIGDVGQDKWEEVDYVPHNSPGLENFGWRVYEGTSRYTADQQPTPTGRLVMPVTTYSHSLGCSITGGYVYHGSAVPALQDRYIYGDFCSGRIWTLQIRNGAATGERQEGITVKNLSSFGLDAAGELYAVSLDGTVYAITG